MVVTIVGITGNIGKEILKECLRRNMQVRGLAPDADAFQAPEGVDLYQGCAADDEILLRAFEGSDVVVPVFPASHAAPWEYPDEVRNVLKCAKLAGVKRVVGVVGSAGTLVGENRHLLDTDYFQETTRHFYQNVHASWEVYRGEKELDWAMIVPAARMEVQVPSRDGRYRYRTDEHLVVTDENTERYWDVSVISYQDCAYALVDEIELHRFTRKFISVGY